MLDTAWPALADPTRRALLALLCQRPHAVGELVTALGLPQPAVSKHLRVLRSAGLVFVTEDAQRRIYSIDPRLFMSLDAWLEPYRRHWNDHLDRLGQHLDAFPTPDRLPSPDAPNAATNPATNDPAQEPS
jgi:DNA-binding transcriptional ArsR family regulator